MKVASEFDLCFKNLSDTAAVLFILKNNMIWMAEFSVEV